MYLEGVAAPLDWCCFSVHWFKKEEQFKRRHIELESKLFGKTCS